MKNSILLLISLCTLSSCVIEKFEEPPATADAYGIAYAINALTTREVFITAFCKHYSTLSQDEKLEFHENTQAVIKGDTIVFPYKFTIVKNNQELNQGRWRILKEITYIDTFYYAKDTVYYDLTQISDKQYQLTTVDGKSSRDLELDFVSERAVNVLAEGAYDPTLGYKNANADYNLNARFPIPESYLDAYSYVGSRPLDSKSKGEMVIKNDRYPKIDVELFEDGFISVSVGHNRDIYPLNEHYSSILL